MRSQLEINSSKFPSIKINQEKLTTKLVGNCYSLLAVTASCSYPFTGTAGTLKLLKEFTAVL